MPKHNNADALSMPGGIYDFYLAPGASDFFRENPDVPLPSREIRRGRRGRSYIWPSLTHAQYAAILDHIDGYAGAFLAPGGEDDGRRDGLLMARWLRDQRLRRPDA